MSTPRLLANRPEPSHPTWTPSGTPPRTRATHDPLPGLTTEPDFARRPAQGLTQQPVQNFDFSNLDAHRRATHTVQATLANVRVTNHTCMAKLCEERLPVREIHRGPHTRLRETATTPACSTAPGSTASDATVSGHAQRHRDYAARHEI
ncbi:hypothetical protein [Streptomyces spectabilis]|uniref:Uncharacterized protein n=1 Tax=Streptomyces spectabilis TaxID=68270 RepID=A0A516RHT0_STRST|nr:hypothetical protein [Streptomyces spectabilis]QDQ15206.1 hypothetical protein FH965_35485 [Streptomyces spectabilis]